MIDQIAKSELSSIQVIYYSEQLFRQSHAAVQRYGGAGELTDALAELHISIATACAGLVFLMGQATSYALEPFAEEAGVASALNGFVQMTGADAVSLSMIALALRQRQILALVMLLGAIFAFAARLRAPRLPRFNG